MTETILTLVDIDIDLDGLADLSATSKEDPSTGHRTLKATTVCELALVRSAMTAHARVEATEHAAGRAELLAMRLQAAEVAFEAAILETKSAGGKGYAHSSGTSRRMREAVFFPVQSPSEA